MHINAYVAEQYNSMNLIEDQPQFFSDPCFNLRQKNS